jgi:hypothetical protein
MEINYGSNTIKAATWGRGIWEYSVISRNNYPKILNTKISDPPTSNKPIEGISQMITSVISYSGTLSSVYVKWGNDTTYLSNTIAMTNTVDSTWVINTAMPNLAEGTKVYFKVYAVGNNGDTSATYRFMYNIHDFEYCNATGNNNAGNLFIQNVSIANITNISANDAYSYNTNSLIHLYRDSVYTIDVISNTNWSSNDFGAWIDFNHNANFDSGENLNLIEISGEHAQASFIVPSNAFVMDTTMLRIRLSYWGSEAQPCGNTLGEVEDYPVLIHAIDNTAPVPDSTSLSDFTAECSATPPSPTATDNIVGTVLGVANVSFPISTIGTTTITWTYTDLNGNSSQQNQNIIVTPVDTSVSISGFTLSANANNYNYQWVDCNNSFSPISGATAQSFTPISNGNYAVILSGNACADTSSCYNIIGLSIDEIEIKLNIEVFPNPTTGLVYIKNNRSEKLSLTVFDITGRQVYSTKISERNTEVNLSNYAGGIYFFKFSNEKEVYYLKLIKE